MPDEATTAAGDGDDDGEPPSLLELLRYAATGEVQGLRAAGRETLLQAVTPGQGNTVAHEAAAHGQSAVCTTLPLKKKSPLC